MPDKPCPRLRQDLDVIQTQHEGEKAVVIKDSLGLIKEPVVLSGDTLTLLSLVDGTNTPRDIQIILMRMKDREFISVESINSFIEELDSFFLLDSERFRSARQDLVAAYGKLEIRKPFLAGKAYPASEKELRAYLTSILEKLNGIGEKRPAEKKILALVAPHIDLHVGKKVYGIAYRAVSSKQPRRVIVLGTGHGFQEKFVSLTDKNFETPLGLIRTDKSLIKELQKAGREAVSPGDLIHRGEHSVEFQLLFLQHVLGSDFLLVPILLGSFNEVLHEFSGPAEIPGMKDFISVLRSTVEEAPDETLVVAGVDFSHVGHKFGHRETASALLEETRKHDRNLIEAICRSDLEKFWMEIRQTDGRYNVCGFSPLACLMEIFPGTEGRLLGYDIWEETPTQSAVSYAAIVIG